MRIRQAERGAVYFTAGDGVEHRVLDCVWLRGTHEQPGRWRIAGPTPCLMATHRIFRPKEGPRRVTKIARGEDRSLEVALLAEQFARAEFLGEQRFDSSRQQPR